MLAASGTAAIGLTAFTGTAAAHEVSTIAFCGCTQVTAYGAFLTGRNGNETGLYHAVLYCDGKFIRRELTGSQTRQNYDMDADDGRRLSDHRVGRMTYVADTNDTITFTICNTHCPSNCATKDLNDALEAGDIDSCDDPNSIMSGGSKNGGIVRQPITVQCSGCGRDDPGHPRKENGKRREP